MTSQSGIALTHICWCTSASRSWVSSTLLLCTTYYNYTGVQCFLNRHTQALRSVLILYFRWGAPAHDWCGHPSAAGGASAGGEESGGTEEEGTPGGSPLHASPGKKPETVFEFLYKNLSYLILWEGGFVCVCVHVCVFAMQKLHFNKLIMSWSLQNLLTVFPYHYTSRVARPVIRTERPTIPPPTSALMYH